MAIKAGNWKIQVVLPEKIKERLDAEVERRNEDYEDDPESLGPRWTRSSVARSLILKHLPQ